VSPARTGRSASRLIQLLLGLLLLAGAGFGLWQALHAHAAELLRLVARPGAPLWLGMALAVEAGGLYLSAHAWRKVSACLGYPLRARSALRIFSAAMLSKYIPGLTWSAIASVQFGLGAGVPAARMIGTYVLSSVIALVTATMVGLLAAPTVLAGAVVWVAPALTAVLLLLWRPALIMRLTALAARAAHRPMPALRIRPDHLRRAILLELCSWLVSGIHVWLIARVLGVFSPRAMLVCLGGFALATVAGALVLVAPDGLGARELVLMGALSTVMTWRQAAAAVLASRVCCTVAEVVGGGMVLLLSTQRAGGRPATTGTRAHEEPGNAASMVRLDR